MAAKSREHLFVQGWYQKSLWLYLLLPLSIIYGVVSVCRRLLFRCGLKASFRAPVPVIVVGNITAGGTGKTPLVIALVEALRSAGFNPGIVSRGYGSQAPIYPFSVLPEHDPALTGDEPLLMALRTSVPVVIDSVRKNAVRLLLSEHDCDVIIADDGMQHYALQRDIEIAVVDAKRGFGNRLLLPAGPLRETVSRLASVDFIVSNGEEGLAINTGVIKTPVHSMQLQPQQLIPLPKGNAVNAEDWKLSRRVHAVAGIGNPQRFYATLKALGFDPIAHSFDDHHAFSAEDFQFNDALPVIMTEKDAVKARQLNLPEHCWYLPVNAVIEQAFYSAVIQQLKQLPHSPLPAEAKE